jgi:hypothetical protein
VYFDVQLAEDESKGEKATKAVSRARCGAMPKNNNGLQTASGLTIK